MANSFNELFGLGSHSEDASLQAWWTLQETAASPDVDDVSSNAVVGSLIGGDDTTDLSVVGPNSYLQLAFDLDGSADYVNFGDVLDIGASDDATFGAWFNVDAFTDTAGIIYKGCETNSIPGFAIRLVNSGSLVQAIVGNGTARTNVSSTGKSTATWYLAAATVDRGSTTLTLYLDGSSVADSAGSLVSGTYNSTRSLEIGRGRAFDTTSRFVDGRVSGGFKFSRVLTSGEHSQIYAGPEPVNSVAPVMSGTETQGQTLSCTSGTWGLDAPFSGGSNGTITYAYQWTRSNDAGGTGEADIGGATSSTYTLQAGDVGKFIRCRVAASNTGGNDPAADTNSNMSGAIASSGGGFQSAWAARSNVLIGAAGY